MKVRSIDSTREQRLRQKYRRSRIDLFVDARHAASQVGDVDGYAVIAWDKDGTAVAKWQSGHIPGTLVGEMAKRTVERTIVNIDIEEAT